MVFLEFFWNSLEILWEFSIFKVSELLTLLRSADCLHSKSQLITESYLNMEGMNFFGKILVFCQDFEPKERKEGRKDENLNL